MSRQEKDSLSAMAPPDKHFASIDVGSHTLRMLIARCSARGEVFPLHTERRITRLAKNFEKDCHLQDQGMEDSLKVLEEYAATLKRYKVESVACGATGVVRRAANSEAFLKAIRHRTGIPAAILSEDSEARLSAKGVLSVLPPSEGHILSFDLGGSSTEFLLLHTRNPLSIWHTSIFIGAATLTERFLRGDPPPTAAAAEASAAVKSTLAPVFKTVQSLLPDTTEGTDQETGFPRESLRLIGTAGTATTLAAMYLEMEAYDPERVNGLVLKDEWLSAMTERLLRSPLAQRRRIPGLEPGREDIIAAGALIVVEILKGLHQPRVTISDAGLLEGLLLNHIEMDCGRPETLVSPLTWGIQRVKGLTKTET